jgi:hypothetical protein
MKTMCLLIICLLPLFLIHCEKKTEAPDLENSLEMRELQTTTPATVNYGEIMNQLFELRRAIIQQPTATPPRTRLLKVAIDSSRQKLYAVGEGFSDSTAKSESLAKQSAERAALIDAQRWVLLTLSWRQNLSTPHFTDQLSGQVPPFQIMQRAELPGNRIYLLIEISL